jgi:hypothetical protein
MPQIPTLQNQVRPTRRRTSRSARSRTRRAIDRCGHLGLRRCRREDPARRAPEGRPRRLHGCRSADRHRRERSRHPRAVASGQGCHRQRSAAARGVRQGRDQIGAGLTSSRARLAFRNPRTRAARSCSVRSTTTRASSARLLREEPRGLQGPGAHQCGEPVPGPEGDRGEIEKIRAAVDQTPGMDEAQKATELGVRRSGVYWAWSQRYLANDQIGAAEKYYQSIKEQA